MTIDLSTARLAWLSGDQIVENNYVEVKVVKIEEVEAISREARKILNLQMTDARALKNRVCCHTIRDLVNIFSDFEKVGRKDEIFNLVKECLLSERRA